MDALGELLAQIIQEVALKYGLFAALFLLSVVFSHWIVDRLWAARLRDKDREIERLVTERNKLQEVILKKRLTSGR